MFGGAGQATWLQNFRFGKGWSVPGYENNSLYDAFVALMNWVEVEEPIDRVIATMWERNNGTNYSNGKVLRQRPICAWPKKAVYVGMPNDPDLAMSWTCQ